MFSWFNVVHLSFVFFKTECYKEDLPESSGKTITENVARRTYTKTLDILVDEIVMHELIT